jgi:SH3-like domain-containing protein
MSIKLTANRFGELRTDFPLDASSVALRILMAFVAISSMHAMAGDKGNDKNPVPNQTQKTVASEAKTYEKAMTRFVHSPRATVRCGPGEQYYSTVVLNKGQSLEVYIETADGWSGVRPPEGSHNWVPADSVYLLPSGRAAEVSVEKVAAWVGSNTTKNEQLLYQTELVKGQSVSIVGEAYRGHDDDKKLWFKIAPPQGEFRWVRSSSLSEEPVPAESNRIASANGGGQKPIRTGNQADSSVKQAGYQAPPQGSGDNAAGSDSGELVWSDETEQLDKVDREIRREQQQIESEMQQSGIYLGDRNKSGSRTGASTAKRSSTKGANGSPNSLVKSGSGSVQKASGSTKNVVDPHSLDEKHWRAMQQSKAGGQNVVSSETGPMDNVLGLLGLSVVDVSPNAGRAKNTSGRSARGEVRPTPYADRNSGAYAGYGATNYGTAPFGSSRLDRLPRPPRRSMGGEHYAGNAANGIGSAGGLFNDLINSKEPLFGGAGNNIQPVSGAMTPGAGVAMADYRNQTNPTMSDVAYDQPDRFQTPQVQEALVQLSAMVSKPTAEWNLAPLRDAAGVWVEQGATPLIRGEARLLLERIERFESIRQRTIALNGVGTVSANTVAPNPVAPNAAYPSEFSFSNANGNSVAPTAPYTEAVPMRVGESASEISGWLQGVHTSVQGQPEFALTDDAGNVLAYVRATTGLNLRRYLQQPVTVYGVKGYIPNLAAKQIVADRVVRLK